MAAREYMVEFREKRGIDLQRMARVCGVSTTLLAMLEGCDEEVTHPRIAERIGKKYKLTQAQIEGMKPKNYRKNNPEYNPDRYVIREEWGCNYE